MPLTEAELDVIRFRSHYESLVMAAALPVLIFLCIFLVDWAQGMRGDGGHDFKNRVKRHGGYFIVSMMLILPAISRRVFQTFQVSSPSLSDAFPH